MKEVKIEKCPFCGGEDLIETRVSAYSGVSINRRGDIWHDQPLFATVCRDCGSVVRSYCLDPEKLFPKKERKNQQDKL